VVYINYLNCISVLLRAALYFSQIYLVRLKRTRPQAGICFLYIAGAWGSAPQEPRLEDLNAKRT